MKSACRTPTTSALHVLSQLAPFRSISTPPFLPHILPNHADHSLNTAAAPSCISARRPAFHVDACASFSGCRGRRRWLCSTRNQHFGLHPMQPRPAHLHFGQEALRLGRLRAMYIVDEKHEPKKRSCFWAWAVDERHRFVRMFFMFVTAVFFAAATFATALPQWNWSWNWGSQKQLRFTREGTFQIAVFEDLHFGESTPGRLRLKWALLIGDRCLGLLGLAARYQQRQSAERSPRCRESAARRPKR